MNKSDLIKQLKDQDSRSSEQESVVEQSNIIDLDDSILNSISGGCALTTAATSCVPPGVNCP